MPKAATAYGSELGIPGEALVAAILTAQFVAFPCTLLFGRLAAQIGAKRALFKCLAGCASAEPLE